MLVFVVASFALMVYVVAWANDTLFTYLGEDDFAHKPVYSYWALTKPAICLCFGSAVMSMIAFCVCFFSWFFGIM